VTGPIDESLPPSLTPEDLLAKMRETVDESARRLTEKYGTIPSAGPEAWAHVELIADLAIAERAQQAVERHIRRREQT
jgi:hypothetical protein